jgi:hypothetical protein
MMILRLALTIPPLLAALVGVWIGSLAATSTSTGLDAANRPWFYFLAVPAQLGMVVIATTVLASWYWGGAVLPTWGRRILSSGSPRSGWGRAESPSVVESARRTPMSPLRTVSAAVGIALSGAILVLLAVPIQVILSTWLITPSDLYSPAEWALVAAETVVAVGWVIYLAVRVARTPGAQHDAAD